MNSGQAKTAIYAVLAGAALIILFWLRYVILMAFLGLLIAILLDSLASLGCRFLHTPRSVAVVISACLLVAALAGTLWLLALPVIRESSGLVQVLREKSSLATDKIEEWKEDFPWIASILPNVAAPTAEGKAPGAPGIARKALITASSLVEMGADALAIFFLGLFLAWNPDRWLKGIAELGPCEGIGERKALFCRIGGALRSYLFTYGAYIVAMGVLWSVGLWIIGIPYFLVFGVLGGLVEVAPYVGPLIGLIPPLLMALITSPAKALYVLLLYAALHIIEGYLLVPYLMHRREHLPPPVIILSLLVCGTLFGTLGALLAVPIGTAVYVVATETLYCRRN